MSMTDEETIKDSKTSELRLLALEKNPNLPGFVIIDASGVNYVDMTGIQVITQVRIDWSAP